MEPQPGTSKQEIQEEAENEIKEEIKEKENKIKDEIKVEKKEIKYFVCHICGLKEEYEYFGKEIPFTRKYKTLEDSFIMEDPFCRPKRGEFLILGSYCTQCGQSVCKDSNCSIYFDGSFCIKCAKNNYKNFPVAVQEKINKVVVP